VAHDTLALTQAVRAARRGLRQDVQQLVSALDGANLVIALAKDVPEIAEGVRAEVSRDVSLQPHLLQNDDGEYYLPMFTTSDALTALEELGYHTDGGDLKYCTLPAGNALDMALDVVDDTTVVGLVIDPGSDDELVLRRFELMHIARGQAVPLVGYVRELPPDSIAARTLVAEPGDAPPADLQAAVAGSLSPATTYRLDRTFNPDRDLEPHLTLTLSVPADFPEPERHALLDRIGRAVEGKVPPPGYLDILFEDSP
jgi:hypothetical protein